MIASPLRAAKDGWRLALWVTPKSSRTEVSGLRVAADGAVALAVKVTAPPDKGKANKAVIEVIAKAAAVPKSAVQLLSGETDRNKTLLITGNPAAIQALIATFQFQSGQDHGEDH